MKAKPTKPSETEQPALFSPEQFSTLPQLVEGAKQYLHTGTTTCKDQERAETILTAYLECGSLLRVSRRFQVSPNTIKAVLDVFERAGKLDDLKQRVSTKLGIVMELSADASIEALMDGRVAPNVLPIMQGVSVEKKALLDGEATQRVDVAADRPTAANDVLTYLRSKGIAAPAIDVESTVSAPIPEENQGKS